MFLCVEWRKSLVPLSEHREAGKEGIRKEAASCPRTVRGSSTFLCGAESILRVNGQILDGEQSRRALTRSGHEIGERKRGTDGVLLAGIRTRGAPLAQRLANVIELI